MMKKYLDMNNDKTQHFVVWSLGSFVTGIWWNDWTGILASSTLWVILGIGKEWHDAQGYGHAELADFIADFLGVSFTAILLLTRIHLMGMNM